MLLLVRNGDVSGEMVVCVDRLHASCIELSSRTTLQCPPLVAVEPKGCDRDPVLLKKLVVGPRGGSAGPPHNEHRSARPYCWRCAPGLNWPGRSSGDVTLKKLECSKCSGPHARYTDVFNDSIALADRPGKRESSARVDYVPALCTHRPSLLPIEWSGEVFGSRRCGWFAARDVTRSPLNLII
ncbi:hypothetical protein V6N13_051426 [Hibiscus sabdariffa]